MKLNQVLVNATIYVALAIFWTVVVIAAIEAMA